jgi:hypothetical protein
MVDQRHRAVLEVLEGATVTDVATRVVGAVRGWAVSRSRGVLMHRAWWMVPLVVGRGGCPGRGRRACVLRRHWLVGPPGQQPRRSGRAASGLPEMATHDYKRNGTTTLFAALEVATGRVTDQCYDRHGRAEFLDFLKKVAKAYPRACVHRSSLLLRYPCNRCWRPGHGLPMG